VRGDGILIIISINVSSITTVSGSTCTLHVSSVTSVQFSSSAVNKRLVFNHSFNWQGLMSYVLYSVSVLLTSRPHVSGSNPTLALTTEIILITVVFVFTALPCSAVINE